MINQDRICSTTNVENVPCKLHAEGAPRDDCFAPKNTFVQHQSMLLTAEISLYPVSQVNYSRICVR